MLTNVTKTVILFLGCNNFVIFQHRPNRGERFYGEYYMRRKKLILGVCALAIGVAVAGLSFSAEANGKFTELPAAGVAVDMGEGSSHIDVQASIESIVQETSSYASNTSSVGLQTIQNNVSVVRAETTEPQSVQPSVVSSEAAYVEAEVKTIQPVTVATVQEVTSEITSEEYVTTTPEVVKAETHRTEEQITSEIASEVEVATAEPVVEEVQNTTETVSETVVNVETASENISTDENVQVTENLEDTQIAAEATEVEKEIIPTEELDIPGANVAVKEEVPAEFKDLVIAQVNDYVNVRAEANTEAEIVGKLYDDSVGTLVKEEDGWYQITSGNVTGYVKAEYCVTGEEAVALAEEVGTEIATVNTTTLKVRAEANLESSVIGLVPLGEELIVVKEEEETEGWVKISIEEGEGYVSTEYVSLRTDFVKAESKEEEQQRLAAEAAAREEAQRAAQQAMSNNTDSTTTAPVITGDSEMGVAVAEYACQFVGNPYVWGGTSLTNGADCSGFVMSVYENFGVSLPHSSTADRTQGYAVDGLANAQPGDLICYSGHVAIYIGNNQIVHASSSKTGIIISNADYKKVLAVRRIF